jgi:hypothetical protein
MSHPLDGARAKIGRAKDQLGSLQFESQRLSNRHVGTAIVGKFNKKTRMYELRTDEDARRAMLDIFVTWSVVIGEIAHNLRSALDGLVCQLAIVSAPGRDWRFCEKSRTAFPIFLHGPKSRKPLKQKFARKKLWYLRPDYVTRIEGLQPYKRGNGYRLSPLWLLRELNNADKHRLIPVVGGWLMGIALHPIEGGVVKLKSGMWLEPDAERAEAEHAEREMNMYAEHFREIAFGDGCDAVKRLPVIGTLGRIADSVHEIIESFSDEFPK